MIFFIFIYIFYIYLYNNIILLYAMLLCARSKFLSHNVDMTIEVFDLFIYNRYHNWCFTVDLVSCWLPKRYWRTLIDRVTR